MSEFQKDSDLIAHLEPLEQAPIFVAQPAADLLEHYDSRRPALRPILFGMAETVEASARFLVLTAVAERLHEESDDEPPEALRRLVAEHLQRPTFGSWVAMLRELGRAGGSKTLPELPGLAERIDALTRGSDEHTSLTALRNVIAHGSGAGGAALLQLLDTWTPSIKELAGELAWLAEVTGWTSSADSGLLSLNGTGLKSAEAPEAVTAQLSRVGDIILHRHIDGTDRLIPLVPFGRFSAEPPEQRDSAPAAPQLYARLEPDRIVYMLFQGTALQTAGHDGFERLKALTRPVEAGRRQSSPQDSPFESEFAEDARELAGRADALDHIVQTVGQSDESTALFTVFGPMGVGKSRLIGAAKQRLAQEAPAGTRLLGYRFIDRDVRASPVATLDWLVGALAGDTEGDWRRQLNTNDPVQLVQTAAQQVASHDHDRVILVLDGLDELMRRQDRFAQALIKQLMRNVPRLHLLLASRPDERLRGLVDELGAHDLFPEGLAGMSEADIRAMLANADERIARMLVDTDEPSDTGAVTNAFIEAITRRADGYPLYVKLVLPDLKRGVLAPDRRGDWPLDRLPEGVKAYFKRIAQDGPLVGDRIRNAPLVAALLALAREPLSQADLVDMLQAQDTQSQLSRDYMTRMAQDVVDLIADFLRISVGADGVPRYRLLHASLRDYILEQEQDTFALTLKEARRTLVAYAQAWPEHHGTYSLAHGPKHLFENDQPSAATDLVTDIDFVRARLLTGSVEAMARQTHDDLNTLTGSEELENRETVEEWLRFWAEIEPVLIRYRHGFGQTTPADMLHQMARDLAPGTAPRESAERAASALTTPFRLRWGYRSNPHLRRVLEGHRDWVWGALELTDGKLLSWGSDSTLRIWAPTGHPEAVLEGHQDRVSGALELTDRRVLSWSVDGTLRLWKPIGEPEAVLEGHQAAVLGALELTDKRLLSWGSDFTLRLWTSAGASDAVLNDGHLGVIKGVLELDDGRLLSWSEDRTLRLFTAAKARQAVLDRHKGSVVGALELTDGHLLSWSSDKTLRLWTATGEPKAVLEGHRKWVVGARELTDGRILSWSADKTLRLWTSDGEPAKVLKGHQEHVNGAVELKDGRFLSWSAEDKTLRLWTHNGDPEAVLEGHQDELSGAVELTDGRLLSWSWDQMLRLWTPTGEPEAVLEGHNNWVTGARELTNGQLLSWGVDETLRLWSATSELEAVVEGHKDLVTGARMLTDGRLLSWSWDRTLRLWSPAGKPQRVLQDHQSEVDGALELNDGRLLSWSRDKTLRLWTPDGDPEAVLRGHEGEIGGAIELTDRRLLSWSNDCILRLWTPAGEAEAMLKCHELAINGALELSDGRLLSWSDDWTLRLWTAAGQLEKVLQHREAPLSGALELNDGRLLSWSYDGTLGIWTNTGEAKSILHGHQGPVSGALELTDGRLLSWGADGTLRLWTTTSEPEEIWEYYDISIIGADAVFTGHQGRVIDALEMPGRHILSCSEDGALAIWTFKGHAIEAWIYPRSFIHDVIPHAEESNVFWLLAGSNVLQLERV